MYKLTGRTSIQLSVNNSSKFNIRSKQFKTVYIYVYIECFKLSPFHAGYIPIISRK